LPVFPRTLLPVPLAVAFPFCPAVAFVPREELVTGDPPGVLVVVALGLVLPAAVIGAVVPSIIEAGALLPGPVAVAFPFCLAVAFVPRVEIVAGDKPDVLVVVVALFLVIPAAVFVAPVPSIVKAGALLPDPVAVAVITSRSLILAILPRVESVAADPVVVIPVLVILRGVPPSAGIFAVVDLVIQSGALLPDPVAVAVFFAL